MLTYKGALKVRGVDELVVPSTDLSDKDSLNNLVRALVFLPPKMYVLKPIDSAQCSVWHLASFFGCDMDVCLEDFDMWRREYMVLFDNERSAKQYGLDMVYKTIVNRGY